MVSQLITFSIITTDHLLQKLPGDITGFKEATRRHAAGLKFAKDQIAEHRKDINYYEPKDYIESYLVEMDRRSSDPCSQFTGRQRISSQNRTDPCTIPSW